MVIRDRGYGYEEFKGDTAAEVVAELIDRINGVTPGYEADPEVVASRGSEPWMIDLERRLDDGTRVPVNVDGGFASTCIT